MTARPSAGPARPAYDVVVPTTGRASLQRLLAALAAQPEPLPGRIWLVDDRPAPTTVPLSTQWVPRGTVIGRIAVLRTGGRGPAAARNAGWRASSAAWIAFLDDDVVPPDGWTAALAEDLAAARDRVGGVQGRIVVPLPTDRRPTDWERNVAGLERARWATADLAYRREALDDAGGFDERFRRNYREDADLGLRITGAGWEIVRGNRTIVHPVGPAKPWTSLRAQGGNADDVLMRRLHGPDWRTRAGAPQGRLPRHAATATAGVASLAALAAGRPRAAALPAALWLALTTELAHARIAPGPKTPRELATMLATSLAMPFAATAHWLATHADRAGGVGEAGSAALLADALHPSTGPARSSAGAQPEPPQAEKPAAILLDRDDTLVVDVPYNGDPGKVAPMPTAHEALARLRSAGIATAVVSNQSGIGRGLLTRDEVERVNARIEELLGPLGPWAICPHAPGEGCDCRKPAPGLIREAARRLGVAPERCVVIGDVGADVEAARAAGARAVLVPTARTRPEEIAAAPQVAPDLAAAVALALGGAPAPRPASTTTGAAR